MSRSRASTGDAKTDSTPPKRSPPLGAALSSCVSERPSWSGCPDGRQVCALPCVCVCFSALSGGALNKVELHDLLILEQSGYKTFLKSWRGC